MRGSAALLLGLNLAIGLAAVLAAAAPGPVAAQQPAPSPSDPPFWARPRPAQPQATPNCDCDKVATPAPSRNLVSPAAIATAVGGLAFLLLLWRWARPRPTPSVATRYLPPAGGARPATPAPTSVSQAAPQTPQAETLDEAGAAERIELVESEEEPTTAESLKFYSDVANSLTEAIEKHPERQDLWRKLFEVYSTSKMASEYVNLAYAFLERHNGRSNPHWREIGAMGRQLLPEHELFREFGDTQAARRTLQFRRHYDRKLDQGALFRAQEKLEAGFNEVRQRPEFQALLQRALADGAHRPAPIAPAPVLDLAGEGARILLKREDRRRSNDEVLVNAIGQVMLAQHLGHRQVVTATRDGTHGLATARVAARLGLECVVYVAESDLREHYARVLSLRQLGAQVRPVRIDEESRFNDARQYAITEWLENVDSALYICGLSGGPQPFPMIVGEIQTMIGHEATDQSQRTYGRLPGAVMVHARDGYFGMGLLRGFLDHPSVRLYYVDAPDPDHAEDLDSSGLYLREHRWLRDTGRVIYLDGNDTEAMRIVEQFHSAGTLLNAATGRTLAHARQVALQSEPDDLVLVAYSTQEVSGWRGGSID